VVKDENARLLTRAHRPRHMRAFWRIWLPQLDGDFISRVTLGAVGALWRFTTRPLDSAVAFERLQKGECHERYGCPNEQG